MATTTRVSAGRRSRSRLLGMAVLSIIGDGPGLLRDQEPCCPAPGAAIVHKTLNEQRNLTPPSWPDDCTEPAGTSRGATVVQVASDPIIHAQSPSPLRHPRSAQADHAPSPFESLLD